MIDEAFDCWNQGKNAHDYHEAFRDWWQRMDALVLRDMNHPAVVMWSIGNELMEQQSSEGAKTAKMLADYVCSRSYPAGDLVMNFSDADELFSALDIGGYNYRIGQHAGDHERVPGRVMVCTETLPREVFNLGPLPGLPVYHRRLCFWTAVDYLGRRASAASIMSRSLYLRKVGTARIASSPGMERIAAIWTFAASASQGHGIAISSGMVAIVCMSSGCDPAARNAAQCERMGYETRTSQLEMARSGGESVAGCGLLRLRRRVVVGQITVSIGQRPTTRKQQFMAEFSVPDEAGESLLPTGRRDYRRAVAVKVHANPPLRMQASTCTSAAIQPARHHTFP